MLTLVSPGLPILRAPEAHRFVRFEVLANEQAI